MSSKRMMFWFLIVFCLHLHLVVPSVTAWSFPWPFNQPSRVAALGALLEADPKTLPHNVRPCRFQAPFDTVRYNQIMVRESQESNCRYELAKHLLDDVESCTSQTSLQAFGRIATQCHYEMSARADRLPDPCSDNSCLSQMSQEAFQVYTAFHLYAERICREVNSRMWMESIEDMVTTLTHVGDDAMERIRTMQEQNMRFFADQSQQVEDLGDKLELVKTKQMEHLELEIEQLERTKERIAVEQTQMENLHNHMTQLQSAMSSFDSIIAILMDIRASQQSLTLVSTAQAFGFYLGCIYTMRSLGFLLTLKDPYQVRIRRIFALTLTSLLSADLMMLLARTIPRFHPPNETDDDEHALRNRWDISEALRVTLSSADDRTVWILRFGHLLVALSLVAMLFVIDLIVTMYWAVIHVKERSRGKGSIDVVQNETCQIQALLDEMIRLRTTGCFENSPSSCAATTALPTILQRMREEPPPGYRKADVRLDGLPLDESVYSSMNDSFASTCSLKSSSSSECFYNELQALDAPHCIAPSW